MREWPASPSSRGTCSGGWKAASRRVASCRPSRGRHGAPLSCLHRMRPDESSVPASPAGVCGGHTHSERLYPEQLRISTQRAKGPDVLWRSAPGRSLQVVFVQNAHTGPETPRQHHVKCSERTGRVKCRFSWASYAADHMRFSERCLLWEERAWEATHVLPTAALLCVECELLVFGAGRKDQGEAEPLCLKERKS